MVDLDTWTHTGFKAQRRDIQFRECVTVGLRGGIFTHWVRAGEGGHDDIKLTVIAG